MKLKILVEIGHPAHVHFFKHAVALWKARGHDLLVVSRQKDLTLPLLDAYGIHSVCISEAGTGLVGLVREMLIRDLRLWRLARQFRPHIMTSIGGTWIAQVGKLTRTPSVVFYDTENAVVSNTITYPLVAALCTPRCYQGETGMGKRHLRYPGYHELAYLHPDRFQPDRTLLAQSDVSQDTPYSIVRLVGWASGHDIGEKGIPMEHRTALLRLLSSHGRVLVSSEGLLPPDCAGCVPIGRPEDIHHLIAFASIVVGESATMASEAAMLGVPAIYIADTGRGYITEQRDLYGLSHHYTNRDTAAALSTISNLLNDDRRKDVWQEKRERMLEDCIDVTGFVVDLIENFPESLTRFRTMWASIQRP